MAEWEDADRELEREVLEWSESCPSRPPKETRLLPVVYRK